MKNDRPEKAGAVSAAAHTPGKDAPAAHKSAGTATPEAHNSNPSVHKDESNLHKATTSLHRDATGTAATPALPPATTLSRRGALKVIAAGTALGAVSSCAPDDAAESATDAAHQALSGFDPLPAGNPLAAGTPSDPDLLAPVVPWEMALGDEELRLVAALADIIIPADERSPAASALGVPDYINEFVSAPGHEEALIRLRGGLAWLNRQARQRFGAPDFTTLTEAQTHQICDPIRFAPDAPPELESQARFFDAFRDMVATGFWTTEEGMRDLGFVGNIPLPSFDGPPPEVLSALGLTAEDLAP